MAFKPKFRTLVKFACGMASTSDEVKQVLRWVDRQNCERSLKESLIECCFEELKHMLPKDFYVHSDTKYVKIPLKGHFEEKVPGKKGLILQSFSYKYVS